MPAWGGQREEVSGVRAWREAMWAGVSLGTWSDQQSFWGRRGGVSRHHQQGLEPEEAPRASGFLLLLAADCDLGLASQRVGWGGCRTASLGVSLGGQLAETGRLPCRRLCTQSDGPEPPCQRHEPGARLPCCL